MRFAVFQVSRNQLRDLMAVLKLRAIDLDHRSGILQQGLGPEKKFADRPASR